MQNYTTDEGGPFGIGNEVLIASHRKLLRSKAVVVSVAGRRNEIPAGKVKRGVAAPSSAAINCGRPTGMYSFGEPGFRPTMTLREHAVSRMLVF